ncbi:MAG: serine/threonine protein kinase [Cellvibrionaceae bacterium]
MPTSINPNVPKSLEDIVLKAMAKKPEDRYASVEEMNQEIRHVLSKKTFVESASYFPALAQIRTQPKSPLDHLSLKIGAEPTEHDFKHQVITVISAIPFNKIEHIGQCATSGLKNARNEFLALQSSAEQTIEVTVQSPCH